MDRNTQAAIAIVTQTRMPVLIWGGPGTGKTTFINQLARKLGLHIETIIASIREPSDFGGLPVVRPDGVVLEPPAWAKRLAALDGKGSIVFIDEISTAPPATQAALLRVIHEGVVGDLVLPPTVARIAAANPPEHAAGGWVLAAALANRFFHFDWTVDSEVWTSGALSEWDFDIEGFRLPEGWESRIPMSLAMVASYIRSKPMALFKIPEHDSDMGKAWPSPRTWDMAARALAAADAVHADDDIRSSVIAGAVGSAAAVEFITWLRNLDLPDPEALLAAPEKYKVPDRHDKIYAVLSSVTTATLSNLTEDRWRAAWKIIAKTANTRSPDIAAFAARALVSGMTKSGKGVKLSIPHKEVASLAPILTEIHAI